MKTSIEISVARDFSRFPGPRFARIGKFSGEEFRDKFLIPRLKEGQKITVLLDDTKGYGSSFLEEAFGGAVREGYSLSKENLVLVSDEDDSLVSEIQGYIDEAMRRKSKNA